MDHVSSVLNVLKINATFVIPREDLNHGAMDQRSTIFSTIEQLPWPSDKDRHVPIHVPKFALVSTEEYSKVIRLKGRGLISATCCWRMLSLAWSAANACCPLSRACSVAMTDALAWAKFWQAFPSYLIINNNNEFKKHWASDLWKDDYHNLPWSNQSQNAGLLNWWRSQ